MQDFLFAKTVSYWQYLVMCTAVGTTVFMGFTGWSLLLALSILVSGASVEAVVEYRRESKNSKEHMENGK